MAQLFGSTLDYMLSDEEYRKRYEEWKMNEQEPVSEPSKSEAASKEGDKPSATGEGDEPWETRRRRLGRFSITEEVMKHNFARVTVAMLGVIVIRCEYRYDSQLFKYVAIGQNFDIVGEGEVPPEYHLVLDEKVQGGFWQRASMWRTDPIEMVPWKKWASNHMLDVQRYAQEALTDAVPDDAARGAAKRSPTGAEIELKRCHMEEILKRIDPPLTMKWDPDQLGGEGQ